MNSIAATLLLATCFAAGLATPTLALAQAPNPAAAAAAVEMADGEVRKVDKDAGKLTLRHGDIKSLDMPPMTMVFLVKEPALLDKVKVGDKVRFRAEKSSSAYVVTAIEPAK